MARAEPFVLEALELRQSHRDLPSVQADLATSLHNAGFLHLTRGYFRQSAESYAAAVDLRSRLFGSRSAPAMSSRFQLAFARKNLGERAEAERLLVEVADFQRKELSSAEEKKSPQVGKVALEYCCTLLLLVGIHDQKGDLVKYLTYCTELRQASKQVANKELGAIILQYVSTKQLQALRQAPKVKEAYLRLLESLEKIVGERHYLYTLFHLEYAYFLFDNHFYEEAEKEYLELETTYRDAYGGDALGLAHIRYTIARAIDRGSLTRTSPGGDPERREELAARVVHYARAAYDQAKKYDGDPEQIGTLGNYLCNVLVYLEPRPDNAEIEALAREAWGIRVKHHGVGGKLDTHPLNYLFVALARQDKVEDLERIFLDVLARRPQPEWDHNASYALPRAAAKLARAGRTRTAVLMLEQAATTGEYDLNSVRTEAAFAPLRESADYQNLLKRMNGPR